MESYWTLQATYTSSINSTAPLGRSPSNEPVGPPSRGPRWPFPDFALHCPHDNHPATLNAHIARNNDSPQGICPGRARTLGQPERHPCPGTTGPLHHEPPGGFGGRNADRQHRKGKTTTSVLA